VNAERLGSTHRPMRPKPLIPMLMDMVLLLKMLLFYGKLVDVVAANIL
jgi:hypothetical protein